MKELRYTLISDGVSDRALLPILTWLLQEHCAEYAIQAEWADLRRLPRPPRGLANRIKVALELYDCDLLFVHRDAERDPHAVRVGEIRRALAEVAHCLSLPPAVCVIPVRMQEAWLLFDEFALRQAAGNPHGRQELKLPSLSKVESLADPKKVLHDLLRSASGRTGRRLAQLGVSTCAQRVPQFIKDFSPLRRLPAFNELERELVQTAEANHWLA